VESPETEQGQTAKEHLASAEPVTEAACGDLETGKDHGIGVYDPLELTGASVQVAHQGGQLQFKIVLFRLTTSRLMQRTARTAQRSRCTCFSSTPSAIRL